MKIRWVVFWTIATVFTAGMTILEWLAISELWRWEQLSNHLKRETVMLIILIPTAWAVALLKLAYVWTAWDEKEGK